MLRGPDDGRDALLHIHPGAGGTESQDWAEMLMRMYTRWAERRGFTVEMLDLERGRRSGDQAGRDGDQRAVRLRPPAGGERACTGWCGSRPSTRSRAATRPSRRCSSIPVVDEDIKIEIDEDDLRIDVYPRIGQGRPARQQDVSAVRITHLPTGIVVACQQERSQFKNKATAMKMLKARLYERAVEEREAKKAEVDKQKTDIAWGNQIRSYVFQPYTMVNDHRTELKVTDVQKVMDGDLDPFIEAYPEALREQGGVSGVLRRSGAAGKARRAGAARHRAVRLPVRAHRAPRRRRSPASAEGDETVASAGRAPRARRARTARRPSRTSRTASGRIQLYFKRDDLGAERYALVGLLDQGDIVGVEGPLFRTRTGEVTVRVDATDAARQVAAPAAARQGGRAAACATAT